MRQDGPCHLRVFGVSSKAAGLLSQAAQNASETHLPVLKDALHPGGCR